MAWCTLSNGPPGVNARKVPRTLTPGAWPAAIPAFPFWGFSFRLRRKARKNRATRGRQADSLTTPPAEPLDPDLARVLAAWPTLAEPIRRAILAWVELQCGHGGEAVENSGFVSESVFKSDASMRPRR